MSVLCLYFVYWAKLLRSACNPMFHTENFFHVLEGFTNFKTIYDEAKYGNNLTDKLGMDKTLCFGFWVDQPKYCVLCFGLINPNIVCLSVCATCFLFGCAMRN